MRNREHGELKRTIGLLDVVMLGAGAAMGVSIFSVLAPAAKVGGSGILISVLIAAAPMVVFAIVYAFMASVVPKSGASYEWPREFIHPFAGFLVAWLRILGSVGVLITLSLVLVQYVSTVVALPAKPTMFGLLFGVFILNIRGIHIAARAQTVAMSLLIVALVIFVITGLPEVRLAVIGNPFGSGFAPILAAVPLMIPLFLGIETATEVGEEVRDAHVAIPVALSLALLLTTLVYQAVAFTALGLLGPTHLAASTAPLLEASQLSLGRFGTPLVLGAAVLALLKSLNAIFVVFSRYLFAMARSGVLPSTIARIHPRWGTPYVATMAAFGASLIGLALPKDLVFLFVAVSLPTVLKYMSTCMSALLLVARRPELVAVARFKLTGRTVSAFSILGILCAVAIFALGYTTDWRPYLLVGIWGATGILYWIIKSRASRTMPLPAVSTVRPCAGDDCDSRT